MTSTRTAPALPDPSAGPTGFTASDGAYLLARIIAEPADDTVRLAYADWLQEQGDEARAEFIRVQCEIARMPEPEEKSIGPRPEWSTNERWNCALCRKADYPDRTGMCRFHELRTRERHLFRALTCEGVRTRADVWGIMAAHVWKLDSDPDYGGDPSGVFRRGFLEHVRFRAADWLAHGDAIRRVHPVTRVRLTTWPALTYSDDDYYMGLVDDLSGPIFGAREIMEGRFADTAMLLMDDLRAVLYLRFQKRVEFTLPTHATT